MASKKERSPDEVAAEFASERIESSLRQRVDPEPDYAREAGLTRVGIVDPDAPQMPVLPSDPSFEAIAGEVLGQAPQAQQPPTAPQPVPTPGGSVAVPQATLENIMIMLVDALGKIAAGQQNAAAAAAQALETAARQQQPDNKHSHLICDLNPQGDRQYARPPLKCKMFIPWEAEPESLTFEEIELLNLLEEGEFIIKRNDGVKVNVTVRMTHNLNGKPDRLLLNSETAFNEENHWMMPPLTSTLRQILATRPHTKKAALEVLTMEERYDMVASGELPVSVGVR